MQNQKRSSIFPIKKLAVTSKIQTNHEAPGEDGIVVDSIQTRTRIKENRQLPLETKYKLKRGIMPLKFYFRNKRKHKSGQL